MLIDFNDDDFQDKVIKEDCTIIQYSAVWCKPCQVQKPILNNLSDSEEFKSKANFYYADVDKAINQSTSASIRGVPTLVVYKKGEEVDRLVGQTSESNLKEFLKKNILV